MTHCKAITKQASAGFLPWFFNTFTVLLGSLLAAAIAVPVAVHNNGNGDDSKEP